MRRTAQTIKANGTMAIIGMDNKHSSHWSPTIILSQCALGANARLTAASSRIAANGDATQTIDILRSPPGRASLVSMIAVRTTVTIVKASFENKKMNARVVVRSARKPKARRIAVAATRVPTATAAPTTRNTYFLSTGSTLVTSIAIKSSDV